MSESKRLNQVAMQGEALQLHFDLGLRAWEDGDPVRVGRHCSAVGMLPEGGPDSLEFLALRWRWQWLSGDRDAALETARDAAARHPGDPDTILELSDILSDLGRDAEAMELLHACARDNPDDADLWYEVGLAAEAAQEEELRAAAFRTVWDLEHGREPSFRLFVPEERFIALAEEALTRLPPLTREGLGNVAVIVEDYPAEWILETDVSDPRVMGLFAGAEHYQQMPGSDCLVDAPSRIHLYRWNIERVCGSEEEVAEQVGITVLHEVGHYLGLDEDALAYLGLG
jgi:predicted Zn-dependent protease with MMP-like domain